MIRFGMALMEIVEQLTKGFVKATGRRPDNLEKIKIQQEAVQRFKDMNKVVDMQGRTLDPSKTIMGGTQEGAALKSGIMKATGTGPKKVVTKGLPDKEFQDLRRSFRMNIAKNSPDFNQDLANRIIKRELYQDLSDTQRKDFLDNLDFVLKNPRDGNADGGRIGLKDGVLKRGLKSITGTDTYKTLEDKGFNAAVLMSEGFDQIFNLLSSIPFAEGGRIGYKDGPDKPGRRKFIKTAVGIATLIPGLGKGIKFAKPAVEKAVELSGPALAKIVETVMSAGKLISLKGKRVKEMVTKKKLKDVEVEEDIMDQSYTIKKGGKEIYYKPGRMDETGGIEDDVIEIIDKTTKKASGGLAKMLGE